MSKSHFSEKRWDFFVSETLLLPDIGLLLQNNITNDMIYGKIRMQG
jgi:hypothetical protein